MKLINHIIPVDIGNNKKLIINSLNGTMDKIDISTYNIIVKWQNQNEITPIGELETSLFENLQARGYIVNNEIEETGKKREIINTLRANDNKARESCRHLTFVMTYDCNFRCPYCFEGLGNPQKNVISPEYIDAALKLANNLESIGLFGGEPLLPKTKNAVEYLISKAPNKTYNITTNGYYLEEFFELLSPLKIAFIMVTLDGEEATHNSRRYLANGNPTFQKIMAGIHKYLENDIPIRIRMNLDENNLEESNRLKQQLMKKFAMHQDKLSFEISAMMEMNSKEKLEINKKLFNEDKKYSYEEREKNNTYWGRNSPIVNAITVGSKIRPTYSFCQAHSNNFLVDPYGYIYPCLPSVGVDALAIGKYYPQIKFNENSIFNRNIEKIEECQNCIYSLLCGGGCPLKLDNYENFYKPECNSIKDQIHNYLPMFYNTQKAGEA
ncbi:MAG: radical SAM protein [Defluviitaleaceae bacterium]|nr:radical SAM protein [Defluviitaleaceae bacterium]